MVHPPYIIIIIFIFIFKFLCRKIIKLLLNANGPFLKGCFPHNKSITCAHT
jgi:hypothetical protein